MNISIKNNMKKIRIKSLELKDWKGQNVKSDFTSDKVFISGRNGSAKTSHVNAWNWLFSGWSNSITPKNHELFDNKEEITVNTPIASVEAVITIDEFEYKLKRTACAKFTRKRGSDVYEKASSDEYKIFIDDIETSISDFNIWIERNICPVDMITYMLNGEFFSTLSEDDKDKARKVLQNIIGEINDDDFKGDYSILFEMMKRYSIDELTNQTKNKIKPINQRLEELPSLIESKQNDLAEYRQIDFDAILVEIEEKKKGIEDIDKAILGASESIKPLIDKRNKELIEIEDKKHELNMKLADFNIKQEELPNKLKQELKHIEEDNRKAQAFNANQQANIKRCKEAIANLEADIERYRSYREKLIEKRDEVVNLVFDDDKCSYCGQTLPYDKLEEARSKFNDNKRDKINLIVEDGRNNNKRIEEAQSKIAELKKVLDQESIPMEIKNTAELEQAIKEAIDTMIRFQDLDEYKDLEKEINELTENITKIPEHDNSSLITMKKKLIDDKEELDRKYGLVSKMKDIEKDIKELTAERKEHGIQLAKLEGLLSQIKEYEREKAKIISSRVNDLLQYSVIEMERLQKDGSKADSCTICRADGVKYSTVNDASRILIKADIQRMFNLYYGVSMPMWIDNASLIDKSSLPKYDECQMIYILNADSDLKIENV